MKFLKAFIVITAIMFTTCFAYAPAYRFPHSEIDELQTLLRYDGASAEADISLVRAALDASGADKESMDALERLSANVYASQEALALIEEKIESFISEEDLTYVLNKRSKKYHLPFCPAIALINEENRQDYDGELEDILNMGYTPCGICGPLKDDE